MTVSPLFPGMNEVIYGNKDNLPADRFPEYVLIDTHTFKRYRSDGTKWIEIGGELDLEEGDYLDIPHDPYYPEKIWVAKYNGREILAGGIYLTGGDTGVERAYLIRYRDGVWTDIKHLVPGYDTQRSSIHGIDWDGEKWWICGRRVEVGDPPLFTIDENDNVTDLSSNISGCRCLKAIRTNGRITLVGGETVGGSNVRKLFKIEGSTYTDITADLPDPGNANELYDIDYSKGVWMVGGEGDATVQNRAWIHSWDETTWTDLSDNLPVGAGGLDYKNKLWCIAHSDKYWAFGLGNYSTFVVYDGAAWTSYDTELPGACEGVPISGIVWTGYCWLFSYGHTGGSGFALWDETTFFDVVSAMVEGDNENIGLRYAGVYAEGCYFTFPCDSHETMMTTGCVRIGNRLCSPWITNKYRGPIDVETVKADMARIRSLITVENMRIPTINVSGGPAWNGSDGDGPYLNLDDNKLYWWSNSAWRSAP